MVDRHITALRRPRPPARHYHFSERDGRWRQQLRARPILCPGGYLITPEQEPVRRPPKPRKARKRRGGTVKRYKLAVDLD
jgi:hypothetical protein